MTLRLLLQSIGVCLLLVKMTEVINEIKISNYEESNRSVKKIRDISLEKKNKQKSKAQIVGIYFVLLLRNLDKHQQKANKSGLTSTECKKTLKIGRFKLIVRKIKFKIIIFETFLEYFVTGGFFIKIN